MLVRHAPTGATRAAAFPADEEVDERGRSDASVLARVLPRNGEAISSPSLRCRQTAAAAGIVDPAIEPALAECDFGGWAGGSLADLDPDDARAWMTDPGACPHGGESLTDFSARVADWLDGQAGREGAAVAFTHGGVVKAAVVRALGAPLEAFWRIDVTPLAITELHAHGGRWTVTRLNARANGR